MITWAMESKFKNLWRLIAKDSSFVNLIPAKVCLNAETWVKFADIRGWGKLAENLSFKGCFKIVVEAARN